MFTNTNTQKTLLKLTCVSSLMLLPLVCSASVFTDIKDWIEKVASSTANTAKVVVTDLPDWMNTGLNMMMGFQEIANEQNPTDANTQGRLLQTGEVNQNTEQATVDTGGNFNKFLTGHSDPMQNKIEAFKRPTTVTYTDKKGVKHTYSTTDSNSLYAGNVHNPGQSQASEAYVKNANGANFGVPDVKFKNPTPEAIDATAFSRYTAAQVTASSNHLVNAHESRQLQSDTKTSAKQHQENVALGDSTDPDYFKKMNKLGVVGRVYGAINVIPGIHNTVHNIGNTAEKGTASLSNLNTQVAVTNQQSFGAQKMHNAISKESGNRKASGKKGGHE